MAQVSLQRSGTSYIVRSLEAAGWTIALRKGPVAYLVHPGRPGRYLQVRIDSKETAIGRLFSFNGMVARMAAA